MHSSLSSSSLQLTSKNPFIFKRFSGFCFSVKPFIVRPRYSKPFSLSASVADKNSTFEFYPISSDKAAPDEYNGWDIEEVAPNPVKRKCLPTVVVTGIGASIAVLLGVLAYFSASSFRLRVRSQLHVSHPYGVPFLADKNDSESEKVSFDVSSEDTEVPEAESGGGVSETFVEKDKIPNTVNVGNERVILPLVADSTQQEAILSLKKLKIIQDDARSDELCTRREYGRWLVLANSQMERSRKHRIISSAAISASTITAFDDVRVEDPDFEYIQSLAEAGVIRSRLSEGNSGLNSDNLEGNKYTNFFPERFISREDLISWKAKIEYAVMPGIDREMSRKHIGFNDVKEISSDLLVELMLDVMADESSIFRRVFGQSKRLQPRKPCTKAQAAVALTSGRMTESIKSEIIRLEAENTSRQNELEEVMQELLERGEIKEFWEKILEEERNRGLELEMSYDAAAASLEQEKASRGNVLVEFTKRNAALDCQRQLLSRLKTEVDEISERLVTEKASCISERDNMQDILRDLQATYDALFDKKSILEAEVEALRKLRSWVEDEAKKSIASAKVLEEAAQRWKWNK